MATQTLPELGSIEPNQHGYREFTLGKFTFNRDEYFAHIALAQGHAHDPGRRVPARHAARRRVGVLLRHRQLRRAWSGTVNHYGTVDLYAGRFNEHYRKAGRDYSENFPAELITRVFQAILEDWTNADVRSLRGAAGDGHARSGPRTAATRRRSRGTA